MPGNVRIIVTATHPNPDYLELHEQKIRQHMFSQQSESIGGGSGSGGGSSIIGRGEQNAEMEGQREAEYESSHRRRKVRRHIRSGETQVLLVLPVGLVRRTLFMYWGACLPHMAAIHKEVHSSSVDLSKYGQSSCELCQAF